MDTIVWLGLGALYLVLLLVLGVTTIRKGHKVLFFVGFLMPVLWLVGAVLPETS
jgi:hypothetical protein